MNIQTVSRRFLALCPMLAVSAANAGTWDYSAAYQLEYSDNIELVAEDGVSGTTHTLSAGLEYQEHSTRLEADVNVGIEHAIYQNNALDDETNLFIDADLRWALVRNRLFWVVTDSLTNEAIDLRDSNVPSNHQQTNVFTTGPSLSYEFDLANRIQADLRYANSYAEEADEFNANRWFAGASWIYGLSATTDISLNATFYDVIFDQNQIEGAGDYQRESIFASWVRRIGSSSLRVEAGLVNVDLDKGDSENGWHGLVEWNRVISPSTGFTLTASHGFSDAALSIAGREDPDSVGRDVISGNIYEVSSVDLAFHRTWRVSVVDLIASYEKQNYITGVVLDQDLASASATWTRNFGGGWGSRFSGDMDRNEYEDGRVDDTYQLYAGADYRSTHNMTYRLGTGWLRRDSTSADSEYEEWSIVFLIQIDR